MNITTIKNRKIKPSRNRVLIKLERDFGAGIIKVINGKPNNIATVLAVGNIDQEKFPDTKEIIIEGTKIVCNNYFGTGIDPDDEDVRILNIEDVQAVLS